MKYEKPEMDIIIYEISAALTTVSGGMENWGSGDDGDLDMPL